LALEDNNISLGRLIQSELGFEVDKGEQKSNWLKRPLTEAQKEYAANDVLYLFELTDRLAVRLQEQGRAQWAAEENHALEAVRYGRDELRPHLRLAGKYRIAPAELPLFRELYALRDRVARQLDRPSYMVLSNDRLAELARQPITSLGALRGAGGLHPDLKRSPYAEELIALATAELAPDGPLPADQRRPVPFKRRFGGPAAARAEARETLLQSLKNHLATDYSPVLANTVLSNRLIGDVVEQGSLAALRPWQRQLLGETARQHGLSIDELAAPL
jgi:ribonuclease D